MNETKQTPLELVNQYQREIFEDYNSNSDYLARAQATLAAFNDRHASDSDARIQLESIRELQPAQILTIISTMEAVEKIKKLAAKDPKLAQEITDICLATEPNLEGSPLSLEYIDIQRLSSKYLIKQVIALGPEINSVKVAWDKTETAK